MPCSSIERRRDADAASRLHVLPSRWISRTEPSGRSTQTTSGCRLKLRIASHRTCRPALILIIPHAVVLFAVVAANQGYGFADYMYLRLLVRSQRIWISRVLLFHVLAFVHQNSPSWCFANRQIL